ncbi:MAG TPA: LPS export ABC transporter periplasmic protein LptC [Gammaproteobacteria bacterium]|jgi:LPS export ABC transporter protein LptC|nr:LPS export ABC transporter periplasmic protein LptC [Gammaproteobacteria bacterium]MDP6732177.1 LPS export ABC transporter periplasmic protein LptC [Gammaproteobacteria bacterium]HAJ75271.1 LPS export ABC transporter periplasmic protein LptC [Gammaproteobacteria bacterium]|tara:strand:- start:1266 stop:1853 length:588 start_codon:yes stop_codon:yes gene_type:complete
MQRLSLFLIPSVIAIVLFTGIGSFDSVGNDSESQENLILLDYDAYSEGINTVLYDADGSINYTLQAESQVHFNDDQTELEKPYIRLFQQGASHWNIIADSGRISAASNESDTASRTIELLGDVEAYSLDEYGNRTVLTTEFLSLNPLLETLETDQLVTLVTTNLQQTSTGMFADLTMDEIVFHQDNRGSYEKILD